MKRVRHLGLALVAIFAFAIVAAATASAAETEAGFLYLPGESGQVKFEGTGGVGTLTSTAGTISCETVKVSGHSTQTEKHITSGLVIIIFNKCKETKGATKVACKTEGAAAEEIAVNGTFNLFNALNTAKTGLEPGIGITITNAEDVIIILKIKCGAVSIVEVKGTVLGLLVVSSLTADVTSGTAHFINAGEICDTENAFCKKAQEKANELLANFTGVFEKATEEIEVPLTFEKMVLVDD